MHGHCVFEESQNQSEGLLEQEVHEPTCHKCYTVNGISFDPNQYGSYIHIVSLILIVYPSGAT